MIKYNNNTIYDWNFDTSNIIKVYRNNAIVFYKISGESPTPEYKVCFAVVDDITQYQETEFEDVFDNATKKWYKLNNLNQYEEYGVYGEGRNITYYEGKLTIDEGDDGEDYSTHYLTLVAQTDNVTFSYSTANSSNKLQYSVDSGSTWNDLSNGSSTSSINNGDRIMFKASGLTVDTERGIGKIIPSASASVEGNIMSLAYDDNFSGQTIIQNDFQFRKLFSGVTTITSAENMVLPATTIKKQCYSQMFQGCSNLVTAPKVIGSSAMTWSGDYCWSDMFNSCTSLVNAPQLPALNLGAQCYWYMFQNCTSLTTAPELLATTTANQCYNGMFSGCTSLNYITVMSSNGFNMYEWVKDVASSGTFIKNPNATWSSCGQNAYPCGWTVQDYVEPAPIKYEYQWNGSEWVNVGEITRTTATLPDVPFTVNYNAKNYDASTQTFAKTEGQLANTDVTITGRTLTVHDGYVTVSSSMGVISGYGTYFNRTDSTPNLTIISKQRTDGYNCHMFANRSSNYNWMYRPYYNHLTLHGSREQGEVAVTTQPVIESVRVDSNRLVTYNNYTDKTSSDTSSFSYGSTNGDVALFNGYTTNSTEQFIGDFYWIYMSQNTLTDEQVQQVINYNEGDGGSSEYPIYYTEKSDPLDNLTFNTMAEAQTYAYNNCVYDGMKATIDGDRYYFDSSDENGWVENYSRLPEGYTEVEYVQNNTEGAYLNLGVKLYGSVGNSYRITAKYKSQYMPNWSIGEYLQTIINSEGVSSPYYGMVFRYSYSTHTIEVAGGDKSDITWTNTDNGDGTSALTISSNSTSHADQVPLGLFASYNGNYTSPYRWSNATFYSMQITLNNVLVRDLVPCIRDNDSMVGMYDLVNDVFYYPPNYQSYQLAAGPIV